MLTRIKVKNFKGFKEAEIPIKPITVLLGANSSGKSSMLQLLLLLQQTAEEASDSYKSALKTFGNRISIGKLENLFYGLERKIPICIQIDFSNERIKDLLEISLSDYIFEASYFYLGPSFREKVYSNDRDEVIEAFELGLDEYDSKGWKESFYNSNYISMRDLHNKDSLALMRNYEFLTNMRKSVKTSSFSFTYTISYFRKNLVISEFSFCNGDTSILSYDGNYFFSEVIDLNENDSVSFKDVFIKNNTIFDFFGKKESGVNGKRKIKSTETSLSKTMIYIINKALSELQNEFKEPFINHVSPLRAHPQRYYMLDKANVTYSLDTYNANEIAEVVKDKPSLKRKVNSWFQQFGLEVDVDEFKEAVHKMTVYQSGLPLDIPDVGFGVSQVLPVVLQGFLSPKKSITIVEQPEVHLHPRMQAALADLFIDIIKESKYTKHLIIETHSEYLLKRLRRRMAERNDILSNDVSINLFHTRTNDNPATIENLTIEERGAFKWPEEFYGNELYDDVAEFLKLQ